MWTQSRTEKAPMTDAIRETLAAENAALRAEVGRLHSLLERAHAELPPDSATQQEIAREYETCTQVVEGLRAQLRELAAVVRDWQATGFSVSVTVMALLQECRLSLGEEPQ